MVVGSGVREEDGHWTAERGRQDMERYCCEPGYHTADLRGPVVVQSQFVTVKFGAF